MIQNDPLVIGGQSEEDTVQWSREYHPTVSSTVAIERNILLNGVLSMVVQTFMVLSDYPVIAIQ